MITIYNIYSCSFYVMAHQVKCRFWFFGVIPPHGLMLVHWWFQQNMYNCYEKQCNYKMHRFAKTANTWLWMYINIDRVYSPCNQPRKESANKLMKKFSSYLHTPLQRYMYIMKSLFSKYSTFFFWRNPCY